MKVHFDQNKVDQLKQLRLRKASLSTSMEHPVPPWTTVDSSVGQSALLSRSALSRSGVRRETEHPSTTIEQHLATAGAFESPLGPSAGVFDLEDARSSPFVPLALAQYDDLRRSIQDAP